MVTDEEGVDRPLHPSPNPCGAGKLSRRGPADGDHGWCWVDLMGLMIYQRNLRKG